MATIICTSYCSTPIHRCNVCDNVCCLTCGNYSLFSSNFICPTCKIKTCDRCQARINKKKNVVCEACSITLSLTSKCARCKELCKQGYKYCKICSKIEYGI